jgi:hypothetical protein
MARPLGLNDLRAIRELQPQGIELDFERARLWPHTPFSAALASRLPFNEIGASTIILHSNHGRRRALGMIQARLRKARPEAHISFISPALDAHPDAVTIWYRLLAEVTNELCEQGCQRVYAQVAADNGAEEVFRQSGFSVYTHEDVYVLSPEQIKSFSGSAETRMLRRQRKRDAWNLLRLYTAATPRLVQQAEGMVSSEGRVGSLSDWAEQAMGTGYVLESKNDSALLGAARLTRGRAANWLRLYLHPQAQSEAGELVCGALGLVRTTHPRPVYCAVREYQGGVRSHLEAGGFHFLFKRSLLVKHTTVRVKEPALWTVPALENPAPIVQTRSHWREPEPEGELQSA